MSATAVATRDARYARRRKLSPLNNDGGCFVGPFTETDATVNAPTRLSSSTPLRISSVPFGPTLSLALLIKEDNVVRTNPTNSDADVAL